jgi:LmbE family N-acetylglucosaminyl deacetylase
MNLLIHEYKVTSHVVILGEGVTSRADQRDTHKWKSELEMHKNNIAEAQKVIGYHSINTYEFPDNRFDSVPLLDIIKTIEKEKSSFKPEVIFTHHGGDVNIDHQLTFDAVLTACRPVEHELVKTIISFETPSGTEWRAPSDPRHFLPNLFIEVHEKHLDTKIKGMECYELEKRTYPHPRSPEALKIQAQRWGVAIGVQYAEAFQMIRSIN